MLIQIILEMLKYIYFKNKNISSNKFEVDLFRDISNLALSKVGIFYLRTQLVDCFIDVFQRQTCRNMKHLQLPDVPRRPVHSAMLQGVTFICANRHFSCTVPPPVIFRYIGRSSQLVTFKGSRFSSVIMSCPFLLPITPCLLPLRDTTCTRRNQGKEIAAKGRRIRSDYF